MLLQNIENIRRIFLRQRTTKRQIAFKWLESKKYSRKKSVQWYLIATRAYYTKKEILFRPMEDCLELGKFFRYKRLKIEPFRTCMAEKPVKKFASNRTKKKIETPGSFSWLWQNWVPLSKLTVQVFRKISLTKKHGQKTLEMKSFAKQKFCWETLTAKWEFLFCKTEVFSLTFYRIEVLQGRWC